MPTKVAEDRAGATNDNDVDNYIGASGSGQGTAADQNVTVIFDDEEDV